MGLKTNPLFWRKSPLYSNVLSFGIIFLGLIGGWVISGQMTQLEETFEFTENNEWTNNFYIPDIQNATISLASSSPGAINILILHSYEGKDIALAINVVIEPGHSWSNRDPPDPLSSPPPSYFSPIYLVSIHLSSSSNSSGTLPYKGNIVVLGYNRDLIELVQHDFVLWIIYIFSFLVITFFLKWVSEVRKENSNDLRLTPSLLIINGVYMMLFFYMLNHSSIDIIIYLPIAFSFIITGLVRYLTLRKSGLLVHKN